MPKEDAAVRAGSVGAIRAMGGNSIESGEYACLGARRSHPPMDLSKLSRDNASYISRHDCARHGQPRCPLNNYCSLILLRVKLMRVPVTPWA